MADFVLGDTNSKLIVTFLRRNGTVFDLTGHTVQIRSAVYSVHNASSQSSASGTYEDMTILTPPTAGRAEYLLNQFGFELNRMGVMYVEFEITEISSGRIVSSSMGQEFTVRGKVNEAT